MAKLLEEIHPGEILLEDFMQPMANVRWNDADAIEAFERV